jgi:hypothetical protein
VAVVGRPGVDVEVGSWPHAALGIPDHVGEPRDGLAVEGDAVGLPAVVGLVGPENEVSAFVAVGEAAYLGAYLVLVEPRSLGLPQQRLVLRVVQIRLHVLQREVRPPRPEDRHGGRRYGRTWRSVHRPFVDSTASGPPARSAAADARERPRSDLQAVTGYPSRLREGAETDARRAPPGRPFRVLPQMA